MRLKHKIQDRLLKAKHNLKLFRSKILLDVVLHTCHHHSFTGMKKGRVFIGGRVDVTLKNRFLVELRQMNRLEGPESSKPLTQSQFFEMLLAEGIMARQSGSSDENGAALQK